MKLLRLKARYRRWCANRKLKASGHQSWQVYRHHHDADINRRAHNVSDFYHGYKYVFHCDNPSHYAYQCLYNYGPGGVRYGYDEIINWCELKSRFKYRADIHRVYKQTGLGVNGEEYPAWFFNDIGGSDYVYFAFMDEQDYMMFLLKWGT